MDTDCQLHIRGPYGARLRRRPPARAPTGEGLDLGTVAGRGLGDRADRRGYLPTDPVSGYPPGAPDRLSGYSWHGALHDYFSLPAFLALTAAWFVFGRRFAACGERGWAAYSVVTGPVLVVACVLSSAGFGQAGGLVGLAALFQRTAVAPGFGWRCSLPTSLGARTNRRNGSRTRAAYCLTVGLARRGLPLGTNFRELPTPELRRMRLSTKSIHNVLQASLVYNIEMPGS
jgi:hypothetical protein